MAVLSTTVRQVIRGVRIEAAESGHGSVDQTPHLCVLRYIGLHEKRPRHLASVSRMLRGSGSVSSAPMWHST